MLVNATGCLSNAHRGHRLSAPTLLFIRLWLHFLIISWAGHFIPDRSHAYAFYKAPGKSGLLKIPSMCTNHKRIHCSTIHDPFLICRWYPVISSYKLPVDSKLSRNRRLLRKIKRSAAHLLCQKLRHNHSQQGVKKKNRGAACIKTRKLALNELTRAP